MKMKTTTFIIGGCRSGKSSHALRLANARSGGKNLFVATCAPQDDEMTARVKRHQIERGDCWQTIEAPLDPAAALHDHGPGADILVIDCLTLWVSNLMMTGLDDGQIIDHINRLCDSLTETPCSVILVSNEVGTGIVPENALARRYRDLIGWCNQRTAAACERVIWMVAGIAVPIKPQPSFNV
jgi:adenosylcobinamide kinase/adenosylcobinamide-phosphate guanylyltransferase